MICSTRAVVEPGAVRALDSRPPLTLRRVRAEPGAVGLCLVGTAAGPLGGDELALTLDIAAGARAELCAAGATIAQGGRSRLTVDVCVGADASLLADPGALIVSAAAEVDVDVRLELAADSTLTWRELLVLGRSGEPRGRARLRWDVVRDGVPLLRQAVDLADPILAGWPGMLAGDRVLLSELRVGPNVDARTVVHSERAVTHRLAEQATLTSVLAPSADALF